MKFKRQLWLGLILTLVLVTFGCFNLKQSESIAAEEVPQDIHILERLTFGIAPGDLTQIKSQGIKKYIAAQLNPESITESPQLVKQLKKFKTLTMTPVELNREYEPERQERSTNRQMQNNMQNDENDSNNNRNRNRNRNNNNNNNDRRKKENISVEEKRRNTQKRIRDVQLEAQQSHLLRSIASKRQLQEVMVDFWFNHFNTFYKKGYYSRLMVGNYEETAIRPHVFGNFRDLLEATARHPMMLHYLDNWLNTDPNSKGARGRYKGINENYARELMELHTLGVDGGYTQADVTSLAKVLTGWGIDRDGNKSDTSGFYFDKNRHDFGDKVILGTTIKGSGEQEIEQALDLLANHPSTARHISYKLAQYFVADKPPEALVDRIKQSFLQSKGNIKTVLETLFNSPEFLDTQYYQTKYRTPYQYVVSLARITGDTEPKYPQMMAALTDMGMSIFGCETPDGYKNTRAAWLNPDGMLRRLNLATAIANGRYNNNKVIDFKKLSETLGNQFSTTTEKALAETDRKLSAALVLGSPDMMYR
jgi:uncharacterized protein (DUF1800 family)